MNKFRHRLFELIEIGKAKDKLSIFFDGLISSLILINIAVTIMMTFDGLQPYYKFLNVVEWITIIFFTLEYIARILTADFLYPRKKKFLSVISFVISFYGIVDLLSFLPFYLPFFTPTGVAVFRLFRVIRIFKLFKINSQFDAFNVIVDVLVERKKQLLSSVVLLLMFMLASSLMMYSVENEAQPEAFENALSGLWWSMATIFTIGYGDIYPITELGKFLALIISFLGVGMVAIPTGIISAGFVDKFASMNRYRGHGDGAEMDFVTGVVTEDHPWCGRKVSEITLPPQSILTIIIHPDNQLIVPHGNTIIKAADRLVIGAANYKNDDHLNEIHILPGDHWIGKKVSELSLDVHDLVVGVKRKGKMVVPNGSTLIKEDDILLMYHID